MFRLEWLESALQELADIWLRADATLRQAITAATHQIEQLLLNDPLHEGESRPGGRRILHLAPLGILYRIEPDGQTVTVLRVWLYRQRRRQGP
jgi:hypothetical protein